MVLSDCDIILNIYDFLVRWLCFSVTVFMNVNPLPKEPEIDRENKIHRYEIVTAHTRSLEALWLNTALQNHKEEISAIFPELCSKFMTEWTSILMSRYAQCCTPKS